MSQNTPLFSQKSPVFDKNEKKIVNFTNSCFFICLFEFLFVSLRAFLWEDFICYAHMHALVRSPEGGICETERTIQ